MASSPITQKYLKSILDYNPETGIFTWRERTPRMFKDGKNSKESKCKRWNVRYAEKEAGCLNHHRYIQIRINNKSYLAHILAYVYMTGKYPNKDIDHDNGNKSDNRWVNLRLATDSQNKANSKLLITNSSGFKGVCLRKQINKWEAQICVNYKTIYLGRFEDPKEAHEAYCAAAIKYFGKFARFE